MSGAVVPGIRMTAVEASTPATSTTDAIAATATAAAALHLGMVDRCCH